MTESITARELVQLLIQHADPDAKVTTEGCDCIGYPVGIDIGVDEVCISRNWADHVPPRYIERVEKAREEYEKRLDEHAKQRQQTFEERLERYGIDKELLP